VGRRFPDVHLPDLWEFPGGKVEPGETGEECARRETAEETGVLVQVRRRLPDRAYRDAKRSVRLEVYLCDYLGGVPQALGCQAVRWASPANLECYRFPDANDPILGDLRDAAERGEVP
jgi:mutator protein MutT